MSTNKQEKFSIKSFVCKNHSALLSCLSNFGIIALFTAMDFNLRIPNLDKRWKNNLSLT